MSNVYSATHRALQDQFDTRRLADLLEGGFITVEDWFGKVAQGSEEA